MCVCAYLCWRASSAVVVSDTLSWLAASPTGTDREETFRSPVGTRADECSGWTSSSFHFFISVFLATDSLPINKEPDSLRRCLRLVLTSVLTDQITWGRVWTSRCIQTLQSMFQVSELSPPHWCVWGELTKHLQTDFRQNKAVRIRKQTEREAGMWRKGVLVSRICREFLIFSLCCCSGRFTNPTCVYLTSWEWDSTINCLCGAFRNSWDKSYWFYL